MRFLLLFLMFLAVHARAQLLYISPKLGDSVTNPPAFHIVSAEQLPQHTLEVQFTQSPIETVPGGDASTALWQFIAGYSCWFEDQFDIATLPNYGYPWLPPYAWVRSINRPCMFGGFAAEQVTFNYFPTLAKEEAEWRGYYKGRLMKIGIEVLPAPPNGVRRFLGVPADE